MKNKEWVILLAFAIGLLSGCSFPHRRQYMFIAPIGKNDIGQDVYVGQTVYIEELSSDTIKEMNRYWSKGMPKK